MSAYYRATISEDTFKTLAGGNAVGSIVSLKPFAEAFVVSLDENGVKKYRIYVKSDNQLTPNYVIKVGSQDKSLSSILESDYNAKHELVATATTQGASASDSGAKTADLSSTESQPVDPASFNYYSKTGGSVIGQLDIDAKTPGVFVATLPGGKKLVVYAEEGKPKPVAWWINEKEIPQNTKVNYNNNEISTNTELVGTYRLPGSVPEKVRRAFGDTRQIAPPTPKDLGAGSGDEGEDESNQPTVDPTAALQRFLSERTATYFDSIDESLKTSPSTISTSEGLKNFIDSESSATPPKWDQGSKAGLSGYVTYLNTRFDSNTDIDDKKETEIRRALSPLQKSGDKSQWRGATIGGVKFLPDDLGLASFLKFAYVASRPDSEAWKEACDKVELGYPQSGGYATDPVMRELILMGAVYPAGVFGFGIADEGMPEGTTISFTPGQSDSNFESATIKYTITSSISPGLGSMLIVGKDENSGLLIAGGRRVKPNVSGNNATAVLRAIEGNETTKFFLQLPGEKRPLEVTLPLSFGASVIFRRKKSPPLVGMTSINASLRPGVTVNVREGQPITLAYQNIYLDEDGQVKQRDVQANLTKRALLAPRKRDVFRLESTAGYMLIPVRIRRDMSKVQEASTTALHWAAAILGPPPGPQPVIAHVPVKSIEFAFEGNYIDYGLRDGALPEIKLVDAVPYEGKVVETDVIAVTEEQANIEADRETDPAKSGIGMMGFDTPFEDQLAAYLRLPGNIVGKPAVLTPALNDAMNSPEPASVGTFR